VSEGQRFFAGLSEQLGRGASPVEISRSASAKRDAPFSRFHGVSLNDGGMMGKAREPEIVYIQQGVAPEWVRQNLAEEGWKFATQPKLGPNVVYYDRRTMPRECKRTGMQRDFCCCAPCRARRRRKHRAPCRCWLCFADRTGTYIDRLGSETLPQRWALFLTSTFRTRAIVKQLNASMERPEPHPDFVRHFLDRMICWLEKELCECVEFFVADQYGEIGGRLHQHIGLTSDSLISAANELAVMRQAIPQTTRLPATLRPFASMLWAKAGFNRILPWEMDAGYYIGRYIGRDAGRCHWNFRVGSEPVRLLHPVGRKVIAISPAPDESRGAYRSVLGVWHR